MSLPGNDHAGYIVVLKNLSALMLHFWNRRLFQIGSTGYIFYAIDISTNIGELV